MHSARLQPAALDRMPTITHFYLFFFYYFNQCSLEFSLKFYLLPKNMLSELFLIHWTQLSLDICFYFLKPSLKHKSQPEHCKSWLPHSSTSLKFHILDWYNFSSYLFFSIYGSNVHATSTVQLIFSFLLNLAYYIVDFRLCIEGPTRF